MVSGRRRSLSCFFTLSAVLLVGVCLLDVEASTCPSSSSIIHKKVGDTVKLSSCLPTEGVTLARWKHRNTIVADKNRGVTKDRFYLNPTDFSLTVKRLTLQDSGNFSFISELNEHKQRPTVVITLQVHEPITKEPDVTVNSTWDDSNKSCTVLLECSSTSDNVTYSWSVKNQTQSGSRLKVNIRPEDGETTVTCTISDHVSEKSASKPVKCRNNSESVPPPGTFYQDIHYMNMITWK
uniref:Ig-like domain-containing protein n=1 Tax=Anabas testudineus TaxID=64144 RepID=A0A7N6ABF7_ANATE